jgi:hypothetical protein
MGVEVGLQQEGTTTWLRWWDESGNLLLTGDERAVQAEVIANQQTAIAAQANIAQRQAEAIAEQERQQKEKLATYLRSMGINPDEI